MLDGSYNLLTMKTVTRDRSVICTEEADDIIEPKPDATTITSSPDMSPEQFNLIKSFPWMAEFIKLCQSEVFNTNIRSLEKLMNIYHKNVAKSVTECYSRPIRAAKLKNTMSETLMFFHVSFSEIKPPLEHSSYLAKMSDLMAMYLDMEIKASRTGTESVQKIASKLTSSLHVYFGHSHDHILDTVLKTKLINKNSWELCDLIFRRLLRDSPGSSVYVVSYIRYLLAFKMWKGIMKWAEDRRRITKLASLKLQPPPGFREKLSSGGVLRDILPRVPKARSDITTFLMQAKYSVKDKSKMFLKAVADPKLQCALDRQNFALAMENSSNCNEKEDNDSIMFMSDSWSSMSLEYDIRDSIRLANATVVSDSKKSNKLKHGGRSNNKNESLKKKRKKVEILTEEIGEDDKEDNSCYGKAIEDSTVNAIKAEVEEVIRKEKDCRVDSICEGDTLEVAAEIELPASPSDMFEIPTIKLEPQPSQSKESEMYVPVWGIPHFQPYYSHVGFDYVTNSRSDEFSLDKTLDKSQHDSSFGVFNKDAVTVGKGQPLRTCTFLEADPGVNIGLSSVRSEEQLAEDCKSIDSLRAQGILFEKPAMKASSEYIAKESIDVRRAQGIVYEKSGKEVPAKYASEEPIDALRAQGSLFEKSAKEASAEYKEKIILHDLTHRSDMNMHHFQQVIIRSRLEKLHPRTWIFLLSSPFSEKALLKLHRCLCNGCRQSLWFIAMFWNTMINELYAAESNENQRTIDEYNDISSSLEDLKAETEKAKSGMLIFQVPIDDFLKKIEVTKEDNEHSNLPLKKRKSFPYYPNNGNDSKTIISYPCTPMISIAELEILNNEKLRSNATNMINHSSVNIAGQMSCVTNYTIHANYQNLPDTNYKTVIMQSDNKAITSEQILVPGAFTTTFVTEQPEQQKIIKFKTPAQLKEFQHLSAARDLIDFAETSRTYYNENQEPQEPKKEKEREKRQTRQKSKSSTKKRKRTT